MRTGTGTEVEAHPETPRFFVTGACELLDMHQAACLRRVVATTCRLLIAVLMCTRRWSDWPRVSTFPQEQVSGIAVHRYHATFITADASHLVTSSNCSCTL